MNTEVKDFIDEGLKKFPQAQKVAETRDYIFIHIPTAEASVFFSQNEKAYLESQGREWEVWCTAKPNTAKFSFPYYARDNMFIFVQNKKDLNIVEVMLVNLTRDTDRFQYVTYDNRHYPLTKTARPQYYKVAETLWNKYERIPKQGELPFAVEEPEKEEIKESKQKTMRTMKMDPDQLIDLGLAKYPDGAILIDDAGDYYAIELKNALASAWFGQIQRAWAYKNEAYPWAITVSNPSASMFDALTRQFKFVYFQHKKEPLDIYMAMISAGYEGKMFPKGVAVYDKENKLVDESKLPKEIRDVCNKVMAEAYINYMMDEYKEKPQVKEAKMIKRDRKKRELNEVTVYFPIFAAIAEGLAVAGGIVFTALLIYLWKKMSKNTDITTTADFQNLSKQEQDEIKKAVANNLDEESLEAIETFMRIKPAYFKPQASNRSYFRKFVEAFKKYLSITAHEIAKEGPPFNKGVNPYHDWKKTDESKSNEPYSEGYNFDEYKNKNGKYLWEETRGSKKRPPLKKPRSFGKFLKPEEPVEYPDYYCEKCGMPISEEDAFVYGGLCMACGEDMSSTRIRNIAEMPNIYEQKQLNEGFIGKLLGQQEGIVKYEFETVDGERYKGKVRIESWNNDNEAIERKIKEHMEFELEKPVKWVKITGFLEEQKQLNEGFLGNLIGKGLSFFATSLMKKLELDNVHIGMVQDMNKKQLIKLNAELELLKLDPKTNKDMIIQKIEGVYNDKSLLNEEQKQLNEAKTYSEVEAEAIAKFPDPKESDILAALNKQYERRGEFGNREDELASNDFKTVMTKAWRATNAARDAYIEKVRRTSKVVPYAAASDEDFDLAEIEVEAKIKNPDPTPEDIMYSLKKRYKAEGFEYGNIDEEKLDMDFRRLMRLSVDAAEKARQEYIEKRLAEKAEKRRKGVENEESKLGIRPLPFEEQKQLNEWVGPDPGLAMYAVMIPMAIYGLYDITREAGKYISYKEFSSFPREKKLDILKDALQVLETEYSPETYADFIDYAVDKVKPRFPAFYSLFMKAISQIGGKRNAYETTIDTIKDKINKLETYATESLANEVENKEQIEEALNNSGDKKVIKEAIMTPDVNEEIISVVFDAVLKAMVEEMSKNDPHMSESAVLERVYDDALEMSDEELMAIMKAIGIWEQYKRIFVEDGIAFELLREKFLEGMESL